MGIGKWFLVFIFTIWIYLCYQHWDAYLLDAKQGWGVAVLLTIIIVGLALAAALVIFLILFWNVKPKNFVRDFHKAIRQINEW